MDFKAEAALINIVMSIIGKVIAFDKQGIIDTDVCFYIPVPACCQYLT